MKEAGDLMSEQSQHIHFENTNRWSTKQLVTMALMCALGALFMYVQLPILPSAPFLTYDPSLVPAMVCGFAYGPGSGTAVAAMAIVIHALTTGDWVGALMNLVATLGYILPAAIVYQKMHTYKGAVIGLVLGVIVATALSMVANLTIGVWFWYGSADAILPLMIPAVLPFNLIKTVLNSVLTLAVYKAVSNLITPKKDQVKGRRMIECRGVSFSYDGVTPALDGIDLNIEDGEFFCILGGNGSGKSTFAKHLNALLQPDAGTVRINGMDASDPELVYDIRSTAGMVFQNPDDQLVATIVEDDVAFGPENLGVPSAQIAQRVREALKGVGLVGFERHETHALSGGQKQRVALAGVLAMEPRVLILDEASSMLDPRGRQGLMKACRALHDRGMTIVMITHFMEEAAEADRVAVFRAGHVAMLGTPEEILTRADELAQLNLDMPASCRLGRSLRAKGVPVCAQVREADMVAEIAQAYAERSGADIAERPSASDSHVLDNGSSAADGDSRVGARYRDFAPLA